MARIRLRVEGEMGQALGQERGYELGSELRTKRQELLGYLEKHAAEIINYERRQQAGKCLGSGRMEKAWIKSSANARKRRA